MFNTVVLSFLFCFCISGFLHVSLSFSEAEKGYFVVLASCCFDKQKQFIVRKREIVKIYLKKENLILKD